MPEATKRGEFRATLALCPNELECVAGGWAFAK